MSHKVPYFWRKELSSKLEYYLFPHQMDQKSNSKRMSMIFVILSDGLEVKLQQNQNFKIMLSRFLLSHLHSDYEEDFISLTHNTSKIISKINGSLSTENFEQSSNQTERQQEMNLEGLEYFSSSSFFRRIQRAWVVKHLLCKTWNSL